MPTTTFFYTRLVHDEPFPPDPLAHAHTFCDARGLDAPDLAFIDRHAEAATPWPDRTAGRELFGRLAPGDHVIVSTGGLCYTSAPDLADALGRIAAAGAAVTFAAEKLTLTPDRGPLVQVAVATLSMLNSLGRSEAIREGMMRKRRSGLQHCHRAPLGHRWAGRKGKRKLVVDEEEWKTAVLMWQWQRDGFSFERIYHHARTLRMTRRDGSEWSLTAIKRAVKRVDDAALPPETGG